MSDELPPNVHKCRIADRDGVEHDYLIVLHPASEGEELMWQLAAMAGESLGGLRAGALGGQGLDADADFAAMGRDLANALRRTNMGDFRAKVLKHATRDGQALANPINFNAAYQANYGELLKAIREVLRVNRLFPGPGMLAS